MADKTQGRVVYTALIMPLSSHATFPKPQPPGGGGQPGAPDQTLPGDLPKPEHPIFFPLPPDAPVDPGYGLPIEHPEHPIQPPTGGQPPGGGGAPPHPSHPIAGGEQPSHPIVLPPDSGGGWAPIYIWGGGPGIKPPLPIPPDGEAPDAGQGARIKFKAVWSPSNGWQTIGVIVPGEAQPVPTPSAKK